MLKSIIHKLLLFIICSFIGLNAQNTAVVKDNPKTKLKIINLENNSWENILMQEEDWWQSKESIHLAENVLLYQRKCGGWPKNIDMMKPLTISEKNDLVTYTNEPHATIDNDATWSQMMFLSKLIEHYSEQRYQLAFLKGLDYLLDAQYKNGGWPQYFPLKKGYYTHITYNDKAMVGVLELLKDITDNPQKFQYMDHLRKQQVKIALAKGIECILKTQIKIDGELTAWCAQHNEKTLRPIGARPYELPSITSKESTEIVLFLMSINEPSDDIIRAVQSAVKWLENVKLTNIDLVRFEDETTPSGYDQKIVTKKDADPLWSRFYDIDSFEPFFSDRDGKKYKKYEDISWERRNEYGWIGDWPRHLMYKKYKVWQQKYASNNDMLDG